MNRERVVAALLAYIAVRHLDYSSLRLQAKALILHDQYLNKEVEYTP